MIDKLRDDSEYYGEEGRAYLSNSDIGALLNNPREFHQDQEDSKNFAMGRYFHQLLLEPDKAANTTLVDASTRNTKVYKEAAKDDGFLLLTKEAEEVHSWVDAIKSNFDFFSDINSPENIFEEPAIGEISGEMWKGKADIVAADRVIDLKTTGDITQFRWNARKYNYDSQAYIYQQLFGKPLLFYVIDKKTLMMGVFTPSEDFIDSGKSKVERAVEVYRRFFGPDATDSVTDYYISEKI